MARRTYRAPRDTDVPIADMAPGSMWINKPTRWSEDVIDAVVKAKEPFSEPRSPGEMVHRKGGMVGGSSKSIVHHQNKGSKLWR